MPEPLAAEALHRTKHSTCGSLSLFDFEPGQYECSMGMIPVAGSNARRQLLTPPLNSAAAGDVCHRRVCRLIRPAADRGYAVPALPEPCCHHGAQGGRLPRSLTVFLPYRFNGAQSLLQIRSTSHFLTGIPAGLWLANTTAVSDAKRHGKRLHLMRAVVLFVSFKILGYSILTGHSA